MLPLGVSPPEYCCNLRFGTEKLEWCGYTMFKDMITRFDTIHERDRQRDRQTDRQDTARRHWRACSLTRVQSRGKNYGSTRASITRLPLFTARQHTDARYWYSSSVRLSVCLSVRHVPVFYGRLNIMLYFLQHTVAQSFKFYEDQKYFLNFYGAPNTGGIYKFCIFDQ